MKRILLNVLFILVITKTGFQPVNIDKITHIDSDKQGNAIIYLDAYEKRLFGSKYQKRINTLHDKEDLYKKILVQKGRWVML